MKKVVIVFAFLVLLCFTLVFITAAETSVETSLEGTKYENSPFCSDSDGGIFTFQQGKITSKNFLGISRVYQDTCIDEHMLRERFCKRGKAHFEEHMCAMGCERGNGVCGSSDQRLLIWSIDIEGYYPEVTYPVGTVLPVTFLVTAYSESMIDGKKV